MSRTKNTATWSIICRLENIRSMGVSSWAWSLRTEDRHGRVES